MSTYDAPLSESLVSACRTGLGEDVRSVVYFTPETYEVLYVRSDLYEDGGEARSVKEWFVDTERSGFDVQPLYESAGSPDSGPSIGTYQFTLRVFSEGYVGRVIVGNHGVILTTDSLRLQEFEETMLAVRTLLTDG